MLPVLLDIHIFKIYTFGVFLVLAFFWSMFLFWRNIRLTSYKEEELFDGLFISLVGGILGGRILYVATHFEKFKFDILKFILINGYPGISLLGAIMGLFLTFYIYCRVKKIKFFDLFDYAAAPLFTALAIGKIGSFFSGVEVGSKTTFPLALKYTNYDGFRHLTALYEGILFFIAAYICQKMVFEIRREKYWKGITFYLFFWVVSMVYFLFDALKTNRTIVGTQSVNWIISAALLLTSSLYFLYHLRSIIFTKARNITSSTHENVKKTYSSIHSSTTKKIRRGSTENSSANRETKS